LKKIIFIGTDTPHRRYFLNEISKNYDIKKIFFEEYRVKPAFKIESTFDKKEAIFEEKFFNNMGFKDLLNKVEVVRRGHDQIVREYIIREKIDLAIVFGASKLDMKSLDILKDYAINIHRGIAEEYRGLDSNFWALYHKDLINVGVTLHKIEDELDKGEIYRQSQIKYPKDIKVFKMRFYETLLATQMTQEFLLDYEREKTKFRKQKKEGRYYSFMPSVLKNLLKFN